MANCVALTVGKEKCGEPTQPGRKYCDEHSQVRKRATNERENDAIDNIVDATDQFVNKIELVKQPDGQIKQNDIPLEQQSIYEKVNNELNDMIAWERTTRSWVLGLSKEEIRREDKTGAEQIHGYIPLYERAQDRVLRGVTAVAKLGIDAQAINVNKMVRELVKNCVARALQKHGMDEKEIEKVRMLLATEFEKVDKESA